MTDRVIAIGDSNDVVNARRLGRLLACELEFGRADQTRLATAISELARNVLQYAGRGRCTVRDTSDALFRRVEVVVEDSGPGIPDLSRALADGYSSGGGLGAGLPGTRRLVDHFDIESRATGTRICIVMERPRNTLAVRSGFVGKLPRWAP